MQPLLSVPCLFFCLNTELCEHLGLCVDLFLNDIWFLQHEPAEWRQISGLATQNSPGGKPKKQKVHMTLSSHRSWSSSHTTSWAKSERVPKSGWKSKFITPLEEICAPHAVVGGRMISITTYPDLISLYSSVMWCICSLFSAIMYTKILSISLLNLWHQQDSDSIEGAQGQCGHTHDSGADRGREKWRQREAQMFLTLAHHCTTGKGLWPGHSVNGLIPVFN